MSHEAGDAYLERFNQIARSLFAVRSGEPLRELAPELTPAVILENEPPDYAILGGKVWWSSKQLTSAAVAAKVSQIDVFNPVGSGLIEVITGIHVVNPPSASSYFWVSFQPTSAGGAISIGQPLDNRAKALAVQFQVGAPFAAVPGPLTAARFAPIATDFDMPLPFTTIQPGVRASLFGNQVNTVLVAVIFGYERPADQAELVQRS